MLKFSKLVALSILLCSQAGLAQEHRVTSEELAHLQNMLKTPDAFKGISAIEVAKSKLELKNSIIGSSLTPRAISVVLVPSELVAVRV